MVFLWFSYVVFLQFLRVTMSAPFIICAWICLELCRMLAKKSTTASPLDLSICSLWNRSKRSFLSNGHGQGDQVSKASWREQHSKTEEYPHLNSVDSVDALWVDLPVVYYCLLSKYVYVYIHIFIIYIYIYISTRPHRSLVIPFEWMHPSCGKVRSTKRWKLVRLCSRLNKAMQWMQHLPKKRRPLGISWGIQR